MKLRWFIAHLLDKLPGQCWADLVSWVYYRWRYDPDLRSAIPWRPMGATCRSDLARVGSCYCAKLRNPELSDPEPERGDW